MMHEPDALVLAGGPDPEREVSIMSAESVTDALRAAGLVVNHQVIDAPSVGELAEMSGAVVFPVLHGPWGEGGTLQELLEETGRPFVGSGPAAARLAMDKIATKLLAASLGVPTAQTALFDQRDPIPPIDPPVVVKPVRDGSSKGVHLVHDREGWDRVWGELSVVHDLPTHMVETLIAGRELTIGLLDRGKAGGVSPCNGLESLSPIEIRPASDSYDYEAKYEREDTGYVVNPRLAPGVASLASDYALRLARGLGIRDLARVDFLMDNEDRVWMLEINTMPGFTSHSLLPMAAADMGIPMPQLCAGLVQLASARGADRVEA
ncbi:MAG: D-alanine--D-alanine ligase [Planctomycetota bacterium]